MAEHVIDRFRGDHFFLSNFYEVKVTLDGEEYVSVEHAYQAAKTTDAVHRKAIAIQASPVQARRLGRSSLIRPTMRKDWDQVKDEIMLGLLRQKFANTDLRARLLGTCDAFLMHGNDHGDMYWGVCSGVGQNTLGILLMEVREECLRKASAQLVEKPEEPERYPFERIANERGYSLCAKYPSADDPHGLDHVDYANGDGLHLEVRKDGQGRMEGELSFVTGPGVVTRVKLGLPHPEFERWEDYMTQLRRRMERVEF